MIEVCSSLDTDKTDILTAEQLQYGLETNSDFQSAIKTMGIKETDINRVFGMMDEQLSGQVTYNEFIDNLHKMKTEDNHAILVFMKHCINDIRFQMLQELLIVKEGLDEVKIVDQFLRQQFGDTDGNRLREVHDLAEGCEIGNRAGPLLGKP